jgi:hypothetical protein
LKGAGAWLACGALQVHLTLYPSGPATSTVPIAILLSGIDDFDGALATLTANGFHEDAAEDDPMRVMAGGRNNGGCFSLAVSPLRSDLRRPGAKAHCSRRQPSRDLRNQRSVALQSCSIRSKIDARHESTSLALREDP